MQPLQIQINSVFQMQVQFPETHIYVEDFLFWIKMQLFV